MGAGCSWPWEQKGEGGAEQGQGGCESGCFLGERPLSLGSDKHYFLGRGLAGGVGAGACGQAGLHALSSEKWWHANSLRQRADHAQEE